MARILPAMKWKCGDCRLNGLPPRPFLSVEARNYLCRWQRTTDPDIIHGHKWRMCRRRSGAKTKNVVFGDCIYHRNRIHGKQKAAPTDGSMKIIWRKFFFLTIYLYLCNRLFELCKALYITVEDRSLNHYLLHFITHKAVHSQLLRPTW